MLVNILAVVLGSSFLIAIFVVYFVFKKLRNMKMKHRQMERVNQWTKKVIVVQPSIDNIAPGLSDTLVCCTHFQPLRFINKKTFVYYSNCQ